MKVFVNFIICAILAVSIPGELLGSDKTVKVGIYHNKPKVFVDSAGDPQGFFIDILNYIASKEGWRLDYVPSTWSENLEKLANAEIDLLLDIAKSGRRAELLDFNKEIVFSNWAIVYVQKDSQIQSILDLKGKKIAAMKGDISFERFRRNIENLGIHSTFEPVDNFSDVLEIIAHKKVDAGIISRLYGLQFENQYDVTRTTIICCPENLYFAVPKKKNKDLIQKIDQHLYQLKRDDQSIFYTSFSKWIEGFSPWKIPAWLVWLLGLAGGTLVAFAVGLVVLKMQVNHRTVELRKRNEELLSEINDRKRAEAEKGTLQAQLIQAQKMEAVGLLAGGIAHDFNNLLQAILGHTEALLFGKMEPDPGYRELQGIRSVAIQAGNLTRQLLTFSSKVESRLRPVDLNLEMQKILKLLEPTLPKRIKIELDLEKDLKIIRADAGQIEQILLNLALNASHAMPDEGSITIATKNIILESDDVRSTHWGTKGGDYVLLMVADTGHGIEKEIQSRIFEPFFTTKAKEQGTGLGLSMVYGIVKNHGGHIECYSEPGAGARFNIFFPVKKSDIIQMELNLNI